MGGRGGRGGIEVLRCLELKQLQYFFFCQFGHSTDQEKFKAILQFSNSIFTIVAVRFGGTKLILKVVDLKIIPE